MKVDMLEVKKDRLLEINKQLRNCIKYGNWSLKKDLEVEKKDLLIQIQKIEMLRGE